MMSDRPNTDDLETLSALFDGALDAGAARFARKRLGHDAQWQQACGRWQLIGDALRGQATAAAPADFAQRVHEALADEPAPVFVPAPAAAARTRGNGARRLPMWIGGALAASLAVVAVFVGLPTGDAPPAGAAPTVVVAPSVVAPGLAEPARPVATPEPAAPPAALASRSEVVPPRAARARAPEAVLAARASTERIARGVQRDLEAEMRVAEAAPDPFRPASEIVTRPWPRAVLPNSQAAGALTASFETPNVDVRAFYPFEPPVDAPAPREP